MPINYQLASEKIIAWMGSDTHHNKAFSDFHTPAKFKLQEAIKCKTNKSLSLLGPKAKRIILAAPKSNYNVWYRNVKMATRYDTDKVAQALGHL